MTGNVLEGKIKRMKWDQLWLAMDQLTALYVRANLQGASWGDPEAAIQLLEKKVKGATNLSVHHTNFDSMRQKDGERLDAFAT